MYQIPPDLISTTKPDVWGRFREEFERVGQKIDIRTFCETHPVAIHTAYRWLHACEQHLGLPKRSHFGRPRKSEEFELRRRGTNPPPEDKPKTKTKRVPKPDSEQARRKYQEALDRAMENAKPSELAAITRARAEITSGMSAPKVNVDVQILLGQEGEDAAKKRLAETFQWLLEHNRLPDELRPLLAKQTAPLLVTDSDDS